MSAHVSKYPALYASIFGRRRPEDDTSVYQPTHEQVEALAAAHHPIVWGEGANFSGSADYAKDRSRRDAQRLIDSAAFQDIIRSAQQGNHSTYPNEEN